MITVTYMEVEQKLALTICCHFFSCIYLRHDDLAYCSMVIYHTHVLRNKYSKELIVSPNTSSIVTVSAFFEKYLEA